MRRIVLIWMAVFMMGGMVMAQQTRRGNKMPDSKVRAERMTEQMVKEYSLNDTQKKQLWEANMTLLEKTEHRLSDIKRGKSRNDSCSCACVDSLRMKSDRYHKRRGGRYQLTDEQRAARTAYDLQLQKIMTNEQYAAYNKKMQDRKAKMESRRK
ncbi:MAG: DUF4890 domain-containing protein [Bacteroides sp.]|nr:DUF4890 domain-containing protein [Bacteroides sp.]